MVRDAITKKEHSATRRSKLPAILPGKRPGNRTWADLSAARKNAYCRSISAIHGHQSTLKRKESLHGGAHFLWPAACTCRIQVGRWVEIVRGKHWLKRLSVSECLARVLPFVGSGGRSINSGQRCPVDLPFCVFWPNNSRHGTWHAYYLPHMFLVWQKLYSQY